MKRKVCVFTSTRADYGLLFWTLRGLQADPGIELQLLCSGTHLCREFGMTVDVIEADGFPVSRTCEIVLASDSPWATAKSLSLAVTGFAEALGGLKPDLMLLLGDRYETFGAAAAATICKVPLAHIHGGETTEGAMDEAFRHSITKMSHLHFACSPASARRLLHLGEQPSRVFHISAPGVENVNRLKLLPAAELRSQLNIAWDLPMIVVTYHPVTLSEQSSQQLFAELLKALAIASELGVLFCLPNADTDGRVIAEMIHGFVANNPNRAVAFTSLGQLRYLSALKASVGCVGNSSSGILEAPTLGVGTVNIGTRQAGRERATSIIDCADDAGSILVALTQLRSDTFQQSLSSIGSPWGHQNASESIVPILRDHPLEGILLKRFYDNVQPA